MKNSLIFQETPTVELATNIFVNVPVIIKYEDTNLMEIVRDEEVGFTTQIPIYHNDGTYLAKVKGNRIFPTEDGKKVNLNIEKHPGLWVCTMEKQTLFEIRQQEGDAFKASAELYTPDGYFIKCTDGPIPQLINNKGNQLEIGGVVMSGNKFMNCSVGIWLKKDGSCSIGVS